MAQHFAAEPFQPRSLSKAFLKENRQVGCERYKPSVSGRDVSLPLASCSAPLLVIFKSNDQEDEESDTLNSGQEKKVVVQGAVIDVS